GCLSAGSIERKHELAGQALPERMVTDELLELRHELRSLPACQLDVDPLLDHGHAALLEPFGLVLCEWLQQEGSERRASPQRRRLLEAARGGERLEPVEVELAGLDPQRVGAAVAVDAVRAEQLPQPGYIGVDRLTWIARRPLTPDAVDEHVARNGS